MARYAQRLRQAQGLTPRPRVPEEPALPVVSAPQRGPLTPRGTAWPVLRRPETRVPEEAQPLALLTAQPPERAEAVTLARAVAALVRTRQPDRLAGWLAQATTRAVAAWRRCAQGLRDDYAAVKAGGTVPWSNGPVEGHINRLKMLPRQMCGRAHLDLLGRRFLWMPGGQPGPAPAPVEAKATEAMRATSGMAACWLLVSRPDVETGQRGGLAGPTASTWGARALAASVRLFDADVHPLSRTCLLQLSPKAAMNPSVSPKRLLFASPRHTVCKPLHLPIGAQAEGSERTWMGRNRSKTGRKTLRCTASDYREILHETWLRGKASAVQAFKTALGELETHLGWTRERRQRMVLHLDGGFGTTEILNWLLSRGCHVVAKISHSGRVGKLRQSIGPWQPTSSPGREIAAVLHPHRFCRSTRQWVIRTPKAKGRYQYAVLVTTLPDLEPVAVADAYDGRAMIEATFCQDKQALGLVTHRQRQWEAQQMVLLLARLAHHLLL